MCISSAIPEAKTSAIAAMNMKRTVHFADQESTVVGYTISRYDLSQIEADNYWMTEEDSRRVRVQNKNVASASDFTQAHRKSIGMFEDVFFEVTGNFQHAKGNAGAASLQQLVQCATKLRFWSHELPYRGLERAVATRYKHRINTERFLTRSGVVSLYKKGASDEEIAKMYKGVSDSSRAFALLTGIGDAWAVRNLPMEGTHGRPEPTRVTTPRKFTWKDSASTIDAPCFPSLQQESLQCASSSIAVVLD